MGWRVSAQHQGASSSASLKLVPSGLRLGLCVLSRPCQHPLWPLLKWCPSAHQAVRSVKAAAATLSTQAHPAQPWVEAHSQMALVHDRVVLNEVEKQLLDTLLAAAKACDLFAKTCTLPSA